MHDIIVFLGPSLDLTTARAILDAEYRPPARRGDLLQAAKEGAKTIVLIDGVFFQDCSVGHREVLAAIKLGTTVIGASSMGALRASELDTFGMIGIGEVYRLYRDGIVVSDDEVALIYDPETYLHLSEPLVNIRHNLDLAVKAGILLPEAAAAILACGRGMYFPDRTYASIIAGSGESGEAFLSFVQKNGEDQKRLDAIEALTTLSIQS
ncbi:TfuA-related McrA-glycine thioamidation protein [Methanosphaerula palustris]|uniref:TfuA domain protein core n=1 Tax=Methanosphaerula palustris (strain ATCC BAA-1556 / DSM 19958 / E1-9c) TaxID=521011 RepID=B8GHE3_METPE|nr:TfuA-related McrA-glycine thioamidation protein [Methanosphaerula palustris]ACL16548.1 TfuA domain protein core [Methanosphaerula palustris E1-9c]